VIAYLSAEWIDALDAALGESSAVRALAPVVVEQVVTGTPNGEVRYRISVDATRARVAAADAADAEPDLRFTTDYPTAVAIASGRENAQTALAAGRLRIGGDVEVLTSRAEAWSALTDAAAALRANTRYE
jgi:putative sterol carrier protein